MDSKNRRKVEYKFSLILITAVLAVTSFTHASEGFTDTLKSYSGSSHDDAPNQPICLSDSELEVVILNSGQSEITFGRDGAKFGRDAATFDSASGVFDSWRHRNYLQTTATGYSMGDFTAELTIDRPSRAGDIKSNPAFFFGLGEAGNGSFNSPLFGDGIDLTGAMFVLQADYDNVSRLANIGEDLTEVEEIGFQSMNTVFGTMRLRLVYDDTAKVMTLSADYDYIDGAVFAADQVFNSIDVSAEIAAMEGGDRSSIFFGGDSGVNVRDYKVSIPELSSVFLPSILGVFTLFIRLRVVR